MSLSGINCFQFLGLPGDHRKHPVQLVLHRDDVPASKLNRFPTYGQVKRDGVFCMLIVLADKSGIFGRTGKALMSTDILASKLSLGLQAGVYFGELQTMCVASLEELSGTVNPNRVEDLDWHQQQIMDGLYIDFFDMLTVHAFIDGKTQVTYLKRHAALVRRMQEASGHLCKVGLSSVLDFVELNNEEEVKAFAQEQVDAGREGAVYKFDDDYEAGHKGYRQTKIVRNISYELRCVGWEEGKGKYSGKVANLFFNLNGKVIKAMLGEGWTHNLAEQMYNDIRRGGTLNVIGRIFVVYALQPSSKGKLRNVKVGELRHDKDEEDLVPKVNVLS